MYRKLKRVWSHSYGNYVPKMHEVFPELNKLSSEEMCDRWIKLGVDFYADEVTPVRKWVRFTLPFAILMMIAMISFIPIYFLITGRWRYNLGENNRIYNWFKSLKLL